MKRDMDLVRQILLEMEKWPANQRDGRIKIAGHAEAEIMHHLGLLYESGLIHAMDASSMDGEAWLPQKITWEGYEFLEDARSDTMWARAKQHALNTAGTLSLEAVKAALSVVVRQAITGV
jgi:hypothetical protein